MKSDFDRRRIVQVTTSLAIVGAGAMLSVPGLAGAARAKEDDNAKPEGVTPPEDLMREHGVLDRVLLIYEAGLRKFSEGETFDPAVISGSAQIVRQFIERYHERNEELHLFPRFRAAGQMLDLVNVLYQQHQAGRRLTDAILGLSPLSSQPGDDRHNLVQAMQAFIWSRLGNRPQYDTLSGQSSIQLRN
jgi:hypothetical protein